MAGGGVAVRLGQVLDPVVPTVAIEVAQRGRGPRAMDHEPCNVVGLQPHIAHLNPVHARRTTDQMDLAPTVQVRFPMQLACFGAVAKRKADQSKIVSAHVVAF